MPFLVQLAQTLKIPCRPIDWWLDEWVWDMSKVDWDLRDDRMTELLLKSLEESGTKTALVTVGNGHIDPFVLRLTKLGWFEDPAPNLDLKIEHFSNVPDAVMDLWVNGIKYLSALPAASTDRLARKIETWKDIVKGKGYLFERSN